MFCNIPTYHSGIFNVTKELINCLSSFLYLIVFNTFRATSLFLYPLKTWEKGSLIFSRCIKRQQLPIAGMKTSSWCYCTQNEVFHLGSLHLLHKEWSFPFRISSFIKEMLNERLPFLCSASGMRLLHGTSLSGLLS